MFCVFPSFMFLSFQSYLDIDDHLISHNIMKLQLSLFNNLILDIGENSFALQAPTFAPRI